MARTEFALAAKLRPRKVSDFAESRTSAPRSDRVDQRLPPRTERSADRRLQAPTRSSLRNRVFCGSARDRSAAKPAASPSCAISCARAASRAAFPASASRCLPLSCWPRTCSINSWPRTTCCDFALHCDDDTEIQQRFLDAAAPRCRCKENLKAFLAEVHYPLAVRSSSLLEDSQYQPFTGVYETFMLGNQQARPADRVSTNSSRPSSASTPPRSASMRRPTCAPRLTAWKKKRWR